MPFPHVVVFLSVELKCQVNSFLKYGFCNKLYTIEAFADNAGIDLFCNMAKAQHCIHSHVTPC